MEGPELLTEATFQIKIEEDDDTVFCPFCFKHLSEFDDDDNAFMEHKEHKPSCAFIQQVSGPRARTSLWNDPFNTKSKQKFTIQEIQNMKNAISKAHWSYIEQTQKEALNNSEVQACELDLIGKLNKKCKGKTRGQALMVKEAVKKLNLGKMQNNYSGNFTLFEIPENHSFPSRSNNPLETFGQKILPALKLREQLGSYMEVKRKSEFVQKSSAKSSGFDDNENNKENINNTTITTPVSSANNTTMMNKTISIPVSDKQALDLYDQKLESKMSPGTECLKNERGFLVRFLKIFRSIFQTFCSTPQIGDTKTLYYTAGDRLIPVSVRVDKANINGIRRISKLAKSGSSGSLNK